MVEKVIIDLLANLESHVNDIPYVINPCKMCKIYKENNGYEIENYNSLGLFENGTCTECCWYYDSKFEVGV